MDEMENIEAVQRMQNYIEKHITEEITLIKLANAAGYSPWYSSKMWLPKHLIKEGTSEYVQGVELPLDYDKPIPNGFEIITLPPCKMMVFQSEPYDDEIFGQAIGEVWKSIEKYNPEIYGFEWAKEDAPSFQLVPMGYRGYIEARPVRTLKK